MQAGLSGVDATFVQDVGDPERAAVGLVTALDQVEALGVDAAFLIDPLHRPVVSTLSRDRGSREGEEQGMDSLLPTRRSYLPE